MATDVKGDGHEAPEPENVVTRVTSLPLVSSAYEMCTSLYNYAKETHPYVTTACNIAEMVAAVAVGSAVGGAQPILNQLEPQIAAVNEYACQKLDELEETLPFLQQPTHQVIEDSVALTKSVVSSTVTTAMGAKEALTEQMTKAVDLTKDIVQDSITLTKSVVSSTVNNAVNAANETKDRVTHKVADVVNLGKETVQDSVDLTKSVVNTALQAAHGTKERVAREVNKGKKCGAVQEGVEMTSFVRQMMSSGVDAMLEKTEELVDHYLPLTEEELVKLSMEIKEFGDASVAEQKQQQSYFIRLGSISHKVRHRAYLHSVNKLQLLKQNTQNMLSQLQLVIDLIENVKQGTGQQFQEGQQKLQQLWSEWQLRTQPGESPTPEGGDDTQPEVESRTLAMLRVITQDLGPAYRQVVSTIQGLPSHIYERLNQVTRNTADLHGSFSSASSFQDLSTSILSQCQEKIVQGREALDTMMEYVTQNTPLNWVVGPFRASPAKEVVMTEIEMSEPSSRETAKTVSKKLMDSGEAMTQPSEAPKEKVTASKPVKVVPKSAAKKVEAEQAKESAKASVAESAPREQPKKAKQAQKEGEKQVEKPNKSSLNKTPEASKEEI